MDDEKLKQLLTPPTPSEPNPETLAQEEQLWQAVVADLANEELHKQYVGLILRNNLIKIGTRRYGTVIDDKEHYPIEARRIARQYQQSLVGVLFISPQARPDVKKSSSFEMFMIIVAAFVALAGLVMYFVDTSKMGVGAVMVLRALFPLSMIFLVWYFYQRYKRARSLLDKIR
ncbi:MAG TPA: hypothetical protein PKW95_01410 [bacterium]|nr:hypothetical protein [bacterium]